ncbi:hypothetical protein HPP92_022327 [Vanilla planifolia]|uniref:Uncharacterized protein n=1 Tax=Vanilla planifolia TaxID=51239 RepID=A0A835PT33_VANPL|nr:hypothetical protein HPP92_022327 [Vanilla planifolia]
MISRGHSYTLSASINVQGCGSSTIWGPYCNNSIDMISCSPSINYKQPRSVLESNLFRSSDDLNLMNGRGLLLCYESQYFSRTAKFGELQQFLYVVHWYRRSEVLCSRYCRLNLSFHGCCCSSNVESNF